MSKIASAFAAMVAFISASSAPPAEAAPWGARDQIATASLIDGGVEGDLRRAGLSIQLDEGWKTYWRSPGETGLPPDFDWSASENVRSVKVLWPAPERFESFGYATYGYQDGVTLPLEVTPEDASKPSVLRLSMFFGVCKDVCAPMDAEVEAPIGAATEIPEELAQALLSLPRSGAGAGVSVASVTLEGEGEERVLVASLDADAPLAPHFALIEGPESVAFGESETVARDGGLVLRAPVTLLEEAALDGAPLVFTLVGAEGATEIEAAACAPAAASC